MDNTEPLKVIEWLGYDLAPSNMFSCCLIHSAEAEASSPLFPHYQPYPATQEEEQRGQRWAALTSSRLYNEPMERKVPAPLVYAVFSLWKAQTLPLNPCLPEGVHPLHLMDGEDCRVPCFTGRHEWLQAGGHIDARLIQANCSVWAPYSVSVELSAHTAHVS